MFTFSNRLVLWDTLKLEVRCDFMILILLQIYNQFEFVFYI
jgi:hypothetical protein